MLQLKANIVCLLLFILPYTLFAGAREDRYIELLKLQGQGKYDQAVTGFKSLISEKPEFTKGYRSLAELYIDLKQVEEGRAYFSRILSADPGNANTYYALARLEFAKKNYQKSIDYYKKSIQLDPNLVDTFSPNGGLIEIFKADNALTEALVYLDSLAVLYPNNPNITYAFARVYQKQYKWSQSYELLNRTMAIDSNYAYTYHALASYFESRGDLTRAKKAAQKLYDLATTQDDLQLAAYALSRIGTHYLYYGDYWKALQFNQQGYTMARDIGAKYRQGYILNTIATLYAMLGRRQKALQYYYRSLELVRESQSTLMILRALLNIGNVLKELKEFDRSEENYRQAEDIARKNGFLFEECLIQTSLGEIYQQQNRYDRAAQKFTKALEIAREIQEKTQVGYILRALGSLYLERGEFKTAAWYHRQALEIGNAAKDLQIIWEARAGLGADYEKSGSTDEAIDHYARAIALYDSVRSNMDIASLTSNFLEDKYQAFPSIIRLLAGQKKYERAFDFAEKYKAKILLDIMADGQLFLTSLLPDSLRSQWDHINANIETLHKELSAEYQKKEQAQTKIVELDRQISDLELKKSTFKKQLRKNYPGYFQLAASEPIKLTNLRKNLLTEKQVLLEYILGPQKISAFVIKNDSTAYFELDLAREQLINLLKRVSPMFDRFENDSTESLSVYTADLVDFSVSPLYQLYRKIFRPLEQAIPKNSQLIIVPDDLLFYIPFEMLIYDTTQCGAKYDFKHALFLLDKYSISYSPAASLLSMDNNSNRKPNKGIFALGNPRFQSLQLEGKNDDTIQEFTAIPQLPNAEIEVDRVADLFPGIPRLTISGREATEHKFKENAPDYQVLHLATHFFFNDRLPLYSKLALAREREDDEDGFLNTYEIFNMKLNADMVVLSACNSALGKLSRGEGVLGISRSFFYAGVPSLLLSLWQVDDKAASDLMVLFYQYLKEGESKDRALQLAKVNFIKSASPDLADPFYWAPFVLIGDQKPIQFLEKDESGKHRYILTGFIIIVVLWISLRILPKVFKSATS